MNQQASQTYQSETVQNRDIATYYSFSGNLTPVTDKVQTAKEAVKVKELYVEEGDRVVKGQALLRGADGSRVTVQENGIIDTLYAEVNDPLQAGAQIAHIIDYDTLEISLDVDEYDIGALSLGKQGDVYLNALDQKVTGIVSEIARDATTEGGLSYYAVKMQIEAPEEIRSGMSVEVSVLNKQALSTPSVSVNALSYDEYNRPFVLLKDAEGRMTAQYISTGVSDGLYIQVTEGLDEGQVVHYQSQDLRRFFMMPGNMQQNRRDMQVRLGN
ncbi:MAG: HlyD family efflux transporter periplasmic adaptor subunit [Clostridia bacterium]|nr:HlyD family efflux transporter periplasmic adaptor subunit [Clostridia bacterium]